MTAEERIAELERELARERAKSALLEAENAQLRQQEVLETLRPAAILGRTFISSFLAEVRCTR